MTMNEKTEYWKARMDSAYKKADKFGEKARKAYQSASKKIKDDPHSNETAVALAKSRMLFAQTEAEKAKARYYGQCGYNRITKHQKK